MASAGEPTASRIPFNKPFIIGSELDYIREAVASGQISGNGRFTGKCHRFFEETFGYRKCLLTTSCTDALEMAALLAGIEPGDEVIVPSYTFVTTAGAFVLRGARIVFADSEEATPNIDASKLEDLVTDRTRAIVPMHYGGVACDMDAILALAERHDLFVIEDAAQAIGACYRGRPLGGIGHLGTLSFHETKNVIAGEGGALLVNDERFLERSEIVWEKGTNRASFFRGEVNKYGWVDVGSSYLPSELGAAFLYAQLEKMNEILERRQSIWQTYHDGLAVLEREGLAGLPVIPDYATNNGHLFYLLCRSGQERDALLGYLREHGVHAVFHYLALHRSPYYRDRHDGRPLPAADRLTACLLRLPMFHEITDSELEQVITSVRAFYGV